MSRNVLVAALAACLALASSRAGAADQQPPAPSSDKREEARRRFQAGVELYEDGDTAAALVEFRRAYELAPSYKLLYNLGQVSYLLRDWVAARDYFRRYLADGGSDVPAPRRAEVTQTLASLERRVGKLELAIDAPGAEVRLDAATLGTGPLRRTLEVNVGRRRVTVEQRGTVMLDRTVEVAGGDTVRVAFGAPPRARVPLPAAQNRAVATTTPLIAERQPKPQPSQGSSGAWVAWSATALTLAAGVGAAVMARDRADALEAERNAYPADPDELERLRKDARTFALVADLSFAAAVVLGGVSIYLSVGDGDDRSAAARPTAFGVRGSF